MSKTMKMPRAVQEMFGTLMRDWDQEDRKRAVKRVHLDPEANKLTREFDTNSMSYFWLPQEFQEDGGRTYYCWSKHRNAAGYFLTWRERHDEERIRRDMFSARKVKKQVKDKAHRREQAHKAGRTVI